MSTQTANTTEAEVDQAREQAVAQIASIMEAMEENTDEDGELDTEAFEQWAQEDALSLEVRSGWVSMGDKIEPEEFRIVLCTGGPHVELQGDIGQYGQAERIRVLYNDWFRTLTEYFPTEDERDALTAFVAAFHLGD